MQHNSTMEWWQRIGILSPSTSPLHPVYNVFIFYAIFAIGLHLLWFPKRRIYSLWILTFLFGSLGLSYSPSAQGTARGVSFVSAIYDPLFNLFGHRNPEETLLLSTCFANQTCSQLSDIYEHHPTWARDFYNRMIHQDGASSRRFFLVIHCWCNSIGLMLCLPQFMVSVRSKYPSIHRWTGRASVGLFTIGSACAVKLGLETGHIESYGGKWAPPGWTWMALWAVIPFYLGVAAARRGDYARHRIWMRRGHGAMCGALFGFRGAYLAAAGMIFVHHKNAVFLAAIWTATPLGCLIGGGDVQRAYGALFPTQVVSIEKKNT